VLRLICWKL